MKPIQGQNKKRGPERSGCRVDCGVATGAHSMTRRPLRQAKRGAALQAFAPRFAYAAFRIGRLLEACSPA